VSFTPRRCSVVCAFLVPLERGPSIKYGTCLVHVTSFVMMIVCVDVFLEVDDASVDGVAPSSSDATADDPGDHHAKELTPVEESVRQQVTTLTNSLITVTQQKSKLEASYIAEKKKLRVT